MSTLSMREFLEEVAVDGIGARERLIDRGHHPNVVYAKALKASRKGYTDYGVVADRCWLEPKGRAFLADGSKTSP
jgi:hypothetical protein